jgi:S1-C subfamily serine protease
MVSKTLGVDSGRHGLAHHRDRELQEPAARAVGHPWEVRGAATAGVVIGVGSELSEMLRSPKEWIAVGLRLRPGHSGGPLIDVNHRLVGSNTLMTGPDMGMGRCRCTWSKRFSARRWGRRSRPSTSKCLQS